MHCTAIFTTQVAPPEGLRVVGRFEPPVLTINAGHLARVTAVVEMVSDELGDPDEPGFYIQEDYYLRTLKAEVEFETETVPPPAPIRQTVRDAATNALRPILFGLKRETGDPKVDTRLASLSLVEYRDNSGKRIGRRSVTINFPDFWPREINEGLWARVTSDTASDGPAIEEQWVLDALTFHAVGEYDLALASAAISAETSARRLLMWKFAHQLAMASESAEKRVRAMHVSQVGQWLLSLDLLTADVLESAARTAILRNNLFHGHHREVERNQSREAIQTAVSIYNSLKVAAGGHALPDFTQVHEPDTG